MPPQRRQNPATATPDTTVEAPAAPPQPTVLQAQPATPVDERQNPAYGEQPAPDSSDAQQDVGLTVGETNPAPGEGYDPDEHPADTETAEQQLERLRRFLAERFAVDEGKPADTAIRLLTNLTAKGDRVERCTEAWCNKPASHLDEHGWINV